MSATNASLPSTGTDALPVKINGIDVNATLKKVETVLSEEKGLPLTIRSLVELLVSRGNLNSNNSSKPPSSDPNRKKVSRASCMLMERVLI